MNIQKTVVSVACTAALLALIAIPGGAQQGPPPLGDGLPAPSDDDVTSADAIIAALYDVISGAAGEERDWDRWRSLFANGSQLIPTGRRPNSPRAGARFMTIEDYIVGSGPRLEESGFFESEIGRHTVSFGSVSHAFSAYESRRTAEGEVFMRGINSIQLFDDGERWWIMNVMWDSERPDNPIPEQYLN